MASVLVGTRKGLVVYDNNGGSWSIARVAFEGVPVSYAMVDPRTGTWLAALDHGHWGTKLHRSADGETWEEIAAPAYPEDAIFKDQPAVLKGIWGMAAGGRDQPGRLYLGTFPGGLFRSDDGGDSWQLARGLWDHPTRSKWFGGGADIPGIHSILVDPRDSAHVTIGVSCGGVYQTTDDGQTWAPTNTGLRADFLPDPDSDVGQDPHFVAHNTNNPDVVWQQNHCGVYRSTDGGHSWRDISVREAGAYFGFAVVPGEDDGTAWLVPAISDSDRRAIDGALQVLRTDDGGQTWRSLRNGLPQQGCFDLVYRHALDRRDETLVFGSTNGNLFASNDEGERWQCLSHHLPPIYSVRFAP